MTTGKRFSMVGVLFLAGLGVSAAIQRGAGRGGASPTSPEPGRAEDAPLPRRIVAIPPSAVEFLFAIGAGGRTVAVGDWCRHPPEATRLPRIGGETNPSLERILALQPDLLIVQGKAERVEAFCRQHGIRILHMNTDTLPTLRAGVRELGRLVGCAAEADRLAARIDLDLAAVAHRVAGRARPGVFLCMSHSPGTLRGLSTAHGASLLSGLLEIAGGRNILGDVELAYPPVSKEELLRRAPDVILDLHPGEELSEEARRQLLADWQAMDTVPAVRNGRVYLLTDEALLIPGPRVARVAQRLAEVLHPEAGTE